MLNSTHTTDRKRMPYCPPFHTYMKASKETYYRTRGNSPHESKPLLTD